MNTKELREMEGKELLVKFCLGAINLGAKWTKNAEIDVESVRAEILRRMDAKDPYTINVTMAAELLGLTRDGVLKAIKRRRIGEYRLSPADIETLRQRLKPGIKPKSKGGKGA